MRNAIYLGLTMAALALAGGSHRLRFIATCCRSYRKTVRAAIARAKPAPMAFSSYSETRPWAKAIREAVRLRRMPPWFADPACRQVR